jgi:hypothetical protein
MLPEQFKDGVGFLLRCQKELGKELGRPYNIDDPILECGHAVLSVLNTHPQDVIRLSHARLHAFPFKDVPESWRRLFCDASLWEFNAKQSQLVSYLQNLPPCEPDDADEVLTQFDSHLSHLVFLLDNALILTGAPGRFALVTEQLAMLSTLLELVAIPPPFDQEHSNHLLLPPTKRRKVSDPNLTIPSTTAIPAVFPPPCETALPPLKHPITRSENLSLPDFQAHLHSSYTRSDNTTPSPIIVTGSMHHWPALSSRPWTSPSYLLSRTIGGRRIVPVEIGRSYTDRGWGQRLMPLRDFMARHMWPTAAELPAGQRGYLAQHDLFGQVPGLRDDVCVPDYCCCDMPGRQAPNDDGNGDDDGDDDVVVDDDDDDNDMPADPLLNAWFGPAHTVSPAHTDPHHNILAQVVGCKYVRLFSPTQTAAMYPRGSEDGIDMSNTSSLDVGLGMRLLEGWTGWDEFDSDENPADDGPCEDGGDAAIRRKLEREAFLGRFPGFKDVEYLEGVLAPGECLYIPKGWWHYVRSLSPSFSVSFWWD